MPASADGNEHDALLGNLALQVGFVTPAELDEARALASRRPTGSIARLLEELGYLKRFQTQALEALLDARAATGGGAAVPSPAEATTMARPHETTLASSPAGGWDGGSGPPPGVAGEERYVVGRELGRGGLGRVLLALDRNLMNREVAMKLVLPPAGATTAAAVRARFLEEARIAGQLWHPNIVPVLELGTRPDGEAYYTMPVVRGRTLKDAIADAHGRLARGDVALEDWGVERLALLSAFQGLCHAIGYAHSRGVIHRDIKPANVMVGEFGETLVIDWGLAKTVRGGEPPAGAIPSLDATAARSTQLGAVLGTPAYMPPEQAAGRNDRVDQRSDIYALGAVLFEVLTGRAPYDGESSADVLTKVLTAGSPPDPRGGAAPGRPAVPDDLADVCLKAMRRAPGERYAAVRELLADVTAAIEGGKERQRRHAEAERLVAEGREGARAHAALRAEQARLRELAQEERRKLTGAEPVPEKAAWWRLEDEERAAAHAILVTFARSEHLFHRALEQEPGHRAAREGLADLYMGKFRETEGVDGAAFRYHEELVRAYHDGKYARELSGEGTLAIQSDPEGAEVHLHRFAEHERRLVPVPWRAPAGATPELASGEVPTSAGWYLDPRPGAADSFVGMAPVPPLALPMGSYLAIVRKGGYRDVRLPIHVGRNEDVRARVRLHTDAEIGAGLIYVPAGPYIAGGDAAALAPGPRRVPHVEGFFIARFPVTCAQYLEFLNAIGAHDPAGARRHAPRWQDHGGMHWIEDPEGAWRLPEGKDPFGLAWQLDEPVVEVTWSDANAYCDWLSAREGRPCRLPTGDEWEKAGRGVDGRIYPWGSHFDSTWCNSSSSRLPGPNRRGPVAEFPADESPYGVRDLGGNVSDWTAELMAVDQVWRAARGGNWHGGEIYCRLASRIGYEPTNPNDSFGFRFVVPSDDP